MVSPTFAIIIVVAVLITAGIIVASTNRTEIMANWTEKRCDLSVMVASQFLKPEGDPRSKTEFAKDNFSFCMKSYVEKFISLFMAPINALFSKQLNVANGAADVLNSIRNIAHTLYDTFSSYMNTFFDKFNTSVFEMSRIIQYLRMAVNRANGIAISLIYSGITIFRSMLNFIQLVIKVVLIICAIMVVILIFLWLFMFPIIPIVIAALAVVSFAVVSLSPVITLGSSVASQADSMTSSFQCFAEKTMFLVRNKEGKEEKRFVTDIQLGDELIDGGKVTAILHMNGTDVLLYNLHGIHVSGIHLVKGTNGWNPVEFDSRSIKTKRTSPILYCFNTTTNNIPVYSPVTQSSIIFRDWKEIGNDDDRGQYMWNYLISKILNQSANYTAWKNNLKMSCDVSVVGKDTLIKTSSGFLPISQLNLSSHTVVDREGKEQEILGIVTAVVENAEETDRTWRTEHYEYNNGSWIKGKCTVKRGVNCIEGKAIITETGEYILWDDVSRQEIIVRDFTEVGHDSLHETYPFVDARLRFTESKH